jgi:hypothetical protein
MPTIEELESAIKKRKNEEEDKRNDGGKSNWGDE